MGLTANCKGNWISVHANRVFCSMDLLGNIAFPNCSKASQSIRFNESDAISVCPSPQDLMFAFRTYVRP
jgi:hypothetical protein